MERVLMKFDIGGAGVLKFVDTFHFWMKSDNSSTPYMKTYTRFCASRMLLAKCLSERKRFGQTLYRKMKTAFYFQ
jgi:hypothetical protein